MNQYTTDFLHVIDKIKKYHDMNDVIEADEDLLRSQKSIKYLNSKIKQTIKWTEEGLPRKKKSQESNLNTIKYLIKKHKMPIEVDDTCNIVM